MVTHLSCACSSTDIGINSFNCSTVVILFLKCHFQSFQALSGISPNNLCLLVAAVLGGSSSELLKILFLLGGSASVSFKV